MRAWCANLHHRAIGKTNLQCADWIRIDGDGHLKLQAIDELVVRYQSTSGVIQVCREGDIKAVNSYIIDSRIFLESQVSALPGLKLPE